MRYSEFIYNATHEINRNERCTAHSDAEPFGCGLLYGSEPTLPLPSPLPWLPPTPPVANEAAAAAAATLRLANDGGSDDDAGDADWAAAASAADTNDAAESDACAEAFESWPIRPSLSRGRARTCLIDMETAPA